MKNRALVGCGSCTKSREALGEGVVCECEEEEDEEEFDVFHFYW
jgi:hypothetical protein